MTKKIGSGRHLAAALAPALALLVGACGAEGGAPSVGATGAALTVAQCSYFANASGRDIICHATHSTKNPYVLLSVDVTACNGHAANHPNDFIDTASPPSCATQGCLPEGAPYDPRNLLQPCCDNLVGTTGTCACAPGLSFCLDAASCVNQQTDLNNCGACGTQCSTTVANATATCSSGVCGFACPSGYSAVGNACLPAPIGAWYLNGNANDATGNNNNGIIANATPTTDRSGKANGAYAFNGMNAHIQANLPNLPTGAAPRTLSVWFYMTQAAPGGTFAQLGPTSGPTTFWMFNDNWEGPTDFFAGGDGPDYVPTTLPVNDSVWHNAVITYDGTTMSVYRDGVFLASKAFAVNTVGTIVSIGQRTDGAWPFLGSLDDVRVWNVALTQSQLAALYSAGPQ